MNVEVVVVRELRTTFLVYNVSSLEAAESEAEKCERDGVSSGRCVKQKPSETATVYAAWSEPVQVRDGKVRRRR